MTPGSTIAPPVDPLRVLLLCQVAPYPPDSGATLKTWNVLRWLAARCAVTLVTFTRDETTAGLDALRPWCRAVYGVPLRRGLARDAAAAGRAAWSGRPWLIERDQRAAMHALVRRLCREQRFDVVHVDQLNMLPYAPRGTGGTVILDAHNALWLAAERLAAHAGRLRGWLLRREAQRLRDYEAGAGAHVDAVLAVSQSDREALRTVLPATPIHVVPIGVDLEAFAPLARPAAAQRIVHVGSLRWPPTVDGLQWFLAEVWPRIRAALPHAGCDLVGAQPPRALRARARAAGGVHVAGYAADPTPYWMRAGAVVVPLRAGAGVRVKILTALAHALPVITTRIGCEGLDVVAGRDVLIADSAAEFAAATVRVLGDRALADELGRNGRRLVEQRYDRRRALDALASYYPLRRAAPGGAP